MSDNTKKIIIRRSNVENFYTQMGEEVFTALEKVLSEKTLFGKGFTCSRNEDGNHVISYGENFHVVSHLEPRRYEIMEIHSTLHYNGSYKGIERVYVGDFFGATIDTYLKFFVVVKRDDIYMNKVERLADDIMRYIAIEVISEEIDNLDEDGKRIFGSEVNRDKDGVLVSLYRKIDFSKFDDRFFSIKGHKPDSIANDGKIHSQFLYKFTDANAVSSVTEDVKKFMESTEGIFNVCYNRYQSIKDESGGCLITLISGGTYRFLAHKDMQPMVNSSFISFKCPYTRDLITKNVSNASHIAIKGMDEFHGQSMQVPLLG